MTNLDSMLKSRDITLPTKICILKAMVFPVVTYGCESWTSKKAERWRIDACGAREDFQKFLGQQGDQTSQSSGRSTLIIHWKDWCWSWSTSILVIWCEQTTHWKSPDAGKDWGQKEKGASEDEMAGRHHQCNKHELGQTPGDGEGQGGLACYSPWSHKESDTMEWLTHTLWEILH